MTHRLFARFAIAMILFSAAGLLSGCAPYQLRGKVIEGDISFIAVVNKDDERLEQAGIPGAELRLETDPGRLNRELVGRTVSGSDGSFTIPVNEPGAGVLIYDVGLRARAKGRIGAEQNFRLPPSGKRILVILQEGVDRQDYSESETLFEEYERLSR